MKYDQIVELMKVANQLTVDEGMNPDPIPTPTPEEVANVQAANIAAADELNQLQNENASLEEVAAQLMQQQPEATEEAIQANRDDADMIKNTMPVEETSEQMPTDELTEEELEQILANVDEEELQAALSEKAANELIELGTLAKIAECARGDLGVEFQKNAFAIIDFIRQGEEEYHSGITKTANELFGDENVLAELFTSEGVRYVFEQLAETNDNGLFKEANEGALNGLKVAIGDAIGSAKQKIIDTAKTVTELDQIQGALEGARAERNALADQLMNNQLPINEQQAIAGRMGELNPQILQLDKQRKMGRGIIGAGAALGTGAALYGGAKLYNALNNEDVVLPQEKLSATLETENNNPFGGMNKMSKTDQFVNDMLKIAGAAMLVSIAEDPTVEFDLRKVAADEFNRIAHLGKVAMGEEFVKAAMTLYPEEQLHEIVANQHTETLFNKVAYFIEADALSIDELEKTANAGGVMATKNVGAGLADAANNIVNTIAEDKDATEGAARNHTGNLNSTGKAGGDLVDTMVGYSVINNPAEYGVSKSAAEELEEAVLMKQAAAQAFVKADGIIKKYAR